jgi:hypothetical protein
MSLGILFLGGLGDRPTAPKLCAADRDSSRNKEVITVSLNEKLQDGLLNGNA